MSYAYAGNSASYPTSITLPDDGDAMSAASVAVPLEAIIDRTEWLRTVGLVYTFANATNANTTYVATGPKTIRVEGSITADRTYILGSTGATNGDILEFIAQPNMSSARSVFIQNHDGSPLITLSYAPTAYPTGPGGSARWARFKCFGGDWEIYEAGPQNCQPLTITATDTSGNVKVPGRCYSIEWAVCGGGGGGESGQAGVVAADTWNIPGGAGGGAPLITGRSAVTAGDGLDFAIGAGGAGGSGSAATDGGDSTITIHGGAMIARARGAQAGAKGAATTSGLSTSANNIVGAFGGANVRGTPRVMSGFTFPAGSRAGNPTPSGPQCGGFGVNIPAGTTADSWSVTGGGASTQGYAGGANGARGTDDSALRAGAGGGGGGAGPFGAGANGGAGGNGGDGVSGGNGVAGSAASANTGAGGGGGGSGGSTNGTAGAAVGSGANGGDGGSGRIMVWFT